ncbi:MAG: McrB family protein, partial [Methanosarcinales archaeon]
KSINLSVQKPKPDKTLEEIENLLNFKKQVVLIGPPGTGKTYHAKRFAEYFTGNSKSVEFIQFHPSYSYEDFIESIRPSLEEGEEVFYEIKDGIFKEFCKTAKENPNQNYVMIIDEINRGNLAKIFGELIYALEYRDSEFTLPYSQEIFKIPDNVYIIGTMNTADRSIALMDIALRRRFMFMELRPDPEVLEKHLEGNRFKDKVLNFFKELNDNIREEEGLGDNFTIGHSHFMVKDMDEQKLKTVWDYSVMPLLKEYFFDNIDKIQKYKDIAIKYGIPE